MAQNDIYIYGRHAVEEALQNAPHAVSKVPFDIKSLPKEVAEANHQGYIARVDIGKLMRPYKEFMSELEVTPDTAIAVLGELQDPQNVGAVIRSAVALGISAILVPEHNQAPITGTVVKVSAGMVFRIPIVSVGNINTTLRDLKDKGFWIYGLDETATQLITEEKFDAPTVFVLGNEATGIREKTREVCDILLSIPMSPKCESLNAATSGAIAFYAWSAKHPPNK